MRIQIWISGVGVLAALFAAGCGDNTEAAVTKRSFIRKADAICLEQKRAIKSQPKVNQTNIKQTLEENIAALRDEFDKVEQMSIPAGDEKEIGRMLKNVQKTLDFAEGNQTNIAEANEYLFKAEEQANDYGMKECWLA